MKNGLGDNARSICNPRSAPRGEYQNSVHRIAPIKEKSRFHTGSPDDEIANAFIPGAQKRSEANLLTAPSSFAAEQDLSANPLQMAHLLLLL